MREIWRDGIYNLSTFDSSFTYSIHSLLSISTICAKYYTAWASWYVLVNKIFKFLSLSSRKSKMSSDLTLLKESFRWTHPFSSTSVAKVFCTFRWLCILCKISSNVFTLDWSFFFKSIIEERCNSEVWSNFWYQFVINFVIQKVNLLDWFISGCFIFPFTTGIKTLKCSSSEFSFISRKPGSKTKISRSFKNLRKPFGSPITFYRILASFWLARYGPSISTK